MDRRLFLSGAGSLALSQILLGCQSSQQKALSIHFLKNSIPAQLVGQFRQQVQSASLKLVPETEIATLYAFLQNQQQGKSAQERPTAHLVAIGDYWLTQAIQQQLIQPLNLAQLDQWSQLPSQWQALVTRDRQGRQIKTAENQKAERQTVTQPFQAASQVWGAPYRWGTTVIAYRKDKFQRLGWQPQDWSDLWRPELKRRFSLLDQPREVIGLTLKKLGYSYNQENLRAVPELEAELRSLNQQVKLYSSTTYLQPLILGDTWLAVGWSTDVLPLIRRNDEIAVVIPRSGTTLWADVWVNPAASGSAKTQELSHQWINFWWQPEVAAKLSRFSNGYSPMLTDFKSIEFKQPSLVPDRQVFERSEFLQPLSPETIAQYQALWLQMRTSS